MLMSVSTVGQADAELIAQLGEAVREEPIDVVLTVPTDGELPPLPPNVRLARFVPHGPLIDRVSLVACHAGNGIVTRAACAGVPLLLFPDGRDRFQVARGATEAGLAITIDRAGLEATAVRGAIRALLDDPAYAQRAAEIARAAAGYNAATAAAEFAERLVTQQLEPMR
jgi:UDP:flavonoid glycosyltransferase YjiC (YdhE family)